jgi:predicted dehydrogenase
MKPLSRRKFLTGSATSLAAAGLSTSFSNHAWAQSRGANDDIRIGIVGVGWKGGDQIKVFNELKGCRIVALCDVDQLHLDEEVENFKKRHQQVKTYRDIRNLLDDKEVDAIVISTPNHWHALITIWACQAGKDVYVEKPVCHDIWEGQRMLEAEKKYGRIIQGGTQNRSNDAFKEGLEYLRGGDLGKILWIHGIDYKYRKSLGKARGPQRIPPTVDYDLFQGPARMQPLNRLKLHYDWHWMWETGNGDIGNIAAHTIDNLRHIMGDDRQPDRVMSLGGRFVYDDDGETPNELLACFDYGGLPAFSEIRNIPHKPGVDYMDNLRDSRESCIVQCEEGYMNLGTGGTAYSNDGKRIKGFHGNGVKEHAANFIKAVRHQDSSLLNCPLKVAVQAGELFHMANLSHRSGFPASLKGIRDRIGGSEAGKAAIESIRGNLTRNGVDLDQDQLTLGSWMSLEDQGTRLKVHNPESQLVAQALFKPRHYRKPFVVPKKV